MRTATASRILGALCALAAHAALAQPEHGDLLRAPERIEWDAGALYDGRFSDGAPFRIALPYPEPEGLPSAARGVMTGAYWSLRRFTGQALPLDAQQGAAGTQVLTVSSDSGAAAPERVEIAFGKDKRDGKGSWTSESGQQRTFTLRRSVPYRALALVRPGPQAQDGGERRPFVFTALFPQLGEGAPGEWVRAMAGRCQADLECHNRITVRWRSDEQLSLEASSWTYSDGAAHGNYRSAMRHYATADGEAVHTRFTNFVEAGAACRAKVSAALVAKLGAQGLSWPEEGALKLLQEPKFIPTPAGIEFHWDPYEVGSYVQGAPSVFLDRAELGDCAGNLPRGE